MSFRTVRSSVALFFFTTMVGSVFSTQGLAQELSQKDIESSIGVQLKERIAPTNKRISRMGRTDPISGMQVEQLEVTGENKLDMHVFLYRSPNNQRLHIICDLRDGEATGCKTFDREPVVHGKKKTKKRKKAEIEVTFADLAPLLADFKLASTDQVLREQLRKWPKLIASANRYLDSPAAKPKASDDLRSAFSGLKKAKILPPTATVGEAAAIIVEHSRSVAGK